MHFRLCVYVLMKSVLDIWRMGNYRMQVLLAFKYMHCNLDIHNRLKSFVEYCSYTQIMPSERMFRLWKRWLEKRLSLLRIWYLSLSFSYLIIQIHTTSFGYSTSTYYYINDFDCMYWTAVSGVSGQVWEEVCSTRSLWHPKHLPVTWFSMDTFEDLPTWTSSSYTSQDPWCFLQPWSIQLKWAIKQSFCIIVTFMLLL